MMQTVSLDLLSALATQAPRVEEKKNKSERSRGNGSFNPEKWVAQTGLKIKGRTTGKSGGAKLLLEECPFQPNDRGGNPFVEQLPGGALFFKCFHGDCANKGWSELRYLVESACQLQQNGSASVQQNCSQSQILVELTEDAELFSTPDGEAFACVTVHQHRETWPIKNKGFRRWLVRTFYQKFAKPPGAQALQNALGVLEAKAQFDSPHSPVFVRVAGHKDRIYIDLCNDRWEVVEITPEGWRIVSDAPVRFRRAKGMLPLPLPVAEGSITRLRNFINIGDDKNWVLCMCWLVAVCRADGPFPILVLQGEQGCGKSSLEKFLRRIIDPSTALVRTPPREDRDLLIAASNSWMLAYDNLSSIPPWLSDALCRLATGGGFSTRELYTDSDEVFFDAMRPVVLNGIDHLAERPDLADRALILNLPGIDDSARKDEKHLCGDFEKELPQILGALFDAVSGALNRLPHVKLERLPRLADFAMWATAAEQSLGFKQGAFLAAYAGSRADAIEATLEADPVASAILALIEKLERAAEPETWTGTSGELRTVLEQFADEETRRTNAWPKTPRGMSGRLRRLVTFLREAGIEITFHPKAEKGRRRLTVARKSWVTTAATATTAARDGESPRDNQIGPQAAGGGRVSDSAEGQFRSNEPPTEGFFSDFLEMP